MFSCRVPMGKIWLLNAEYLKRAVLQRFSNKVDNTNVIYQFSQWELYTTASQISALRCEGQTR